MGVCGMMDLGVSSGKISIIPDDTAVGGEVIIQTFGVKDVGMLTLLAFPICSEHLFSILALFLAYKAILKIGGFVSGRRGVFKLQKYSLACEHVQNCCVEMSTALVFHALCPNFYCLCCSVQRNFCEV